MFLFARIGSFYVFYSHCPLPSPHSPFPSLTPPPPFPTRYIHCTLFRPSLPPSLPFSFPHCPLPYPHYPFPSLTAHFPPSLPPFIPHCPLPSLTAPFPPSLPDPLPFSLLYSPTPLLNGDINVQGFCFIRGWNRAGFLVK